MGCHGCVPSFTGYSSLSCIWIFPTGYQGIDETSRKKNRLNEAEIAFRRRREEIATSGAPQNDCCRLGLRSPLFGLHCSLLCGTTVVRRSHVRTHPLAACSRLRTWPPLVPRAPTRRASRPGSLNLASGFDAGAAPGQGWCSVHEGSPLSRRVNIRSMSAFSATPGSPKGSTPSGNAGELPGNEVYGRHLTA